MGKYFCDYKIKYSEDIACGLEIAIDVIIEKKQQ